MFRILVLRKLSVKMHVNLVFLFVICLNVPQFYQRSTFNDSYNGNEIKPTEDEPRATVQVPELLGKGMYGASFGGELVLCTFTPMTNQKCYAIKHAEEYYLLLENEFIRITGRLSPFVNKQGFKDFKEVNIEFFDEQGRVAAVLPFSYYHPLPELIAAYNKVQFLDADKDIRVTSITQLSTIFLFNDRRQININLLMAIDGVWISIGMAPELLSRSVGILVHGVPRNRALPITFHDEGFDLRGCDYILEFHNDDAETMDNKEHNGTKEYSYGICMRNGRVLNSMRPKHTLVHLPENTTKTSSEFNVLDGYKNKEKVEYSADDLAYVKQRLPENCDCEHFNKKDSHTIYWGPKNMSQSIIIYPHSFITAERDGDTRDVVMKAILGSGYNDSSPIEITTSEALYEPGIEPSNLIVNYDKDDVRLSKISKRSTYDKANESDSIEYKVLEISFLEWLKNPEHRAALCKAASSIYPKRLIITLQPKSFLECKENNEVELVRCDDVVGACNGGYTLAFNL